MSKPKPTPPKVTHKVGREIVNFLAPTPVRILLEPNAVPRDVFDLQPHSKSALVGPQLGLPYTEVRLPSGHIVIEFEPELFLDKTVYLFRQGRASVRGADSAWGPIEHVAGAELTHPTWHTPGPPVMSPPQKAPSNIPRPRTTPPRPHDPLLREDVTDFTQVRVEEPKMADAK